MGEYLAEKFYDHTNFVNIYYAAQMTIEKYFAGNIFRGDISRVIFASDDYAFRKRYELVDKSVYYDNVKASSLQFPFMNYWYSGYWDYDDRSASVQTPQIVFGSTHSEFSKNLKAIAVKSLFSSTLYFSRDDDARLAYEYILWDRSPSRIIRLATSLYWQGQSLGIPIFVTIDSSDFNTQFTENDWLKSNRIIPIKIGFTIRTYIIYPEDQTKLDLSTGVDSIIRDPAESVYITEEVLLDFFAGKNLEYDVETITDTVSAVFDPDYDITIDDVTTSNLTYNSVNIAWTITDTGDEADALDKVKIIISGLDPIIVESTESDYDVTGLNENSEYDVTLMFYLKNTKVYLYNLTINTANDPATPATQIGSLKGIVF